MQQHHQDIGNSKVLFEDILDNLKTVISNNLSAKLSSISTESAIKFLKEFEKEGIIKLEGKDIRIIDRKALTTTSKNG